MNYIYGTFLVLRGLEAIGIWNHEPQIQQAAEWIRIGAERGWRLGRTCDSYDDPDHARHRAEHAIADGVGVAGAAGCGRHAQRLRGEGRSLAASNAARRGIVGRELGRGTRRRGNYTGTGFPRVFYLAYHLYRDYFPLLALTSYRAGDGTHAQ